MLINGAESDIMEKVKNNGAKSADVAKDDSMEQRILEVAERLFLERGFQATSTTDIAKEVGCNQALVHYYYRTKQMLFERVFTTKVKKFSSIFLANDTLEGTFEQKLRRKVELHYDLMVENRHLPLFIINELNANPERIQMVRAVIGSIPTTIYMVMRKELKEEIRAGRVRPISTINLMLNIISLNAFHVVATPFVAAILSGTTGNMDKIVANRKQVIVDTIINSIRP